MMAAYAAIVTLMDTINHIHNHPRLSKSLEMMQHMESLRNEFRFLQDFLEEGYSHQGSEEAQKLERETASAACIADDLIRSHVADNQAGHLPRDLDMVRFSRKILAMITFSRRSLAMVNICFLAMGIRHDRLLVWSVILWILGLYLHGKLSRPAPVPWLQTDTFVDKLILQHELLEHKGYGTSILFGGYSHYMTSTDIFTLQLEMIIGSVGTMRRRVMKIQSDNKVVNDQHRSRFLKLVTAS